MSRANHRQRAAGVAAAALALIASIARPATAGVTYAAALSPAVRDAVTVLQPWIDEQMSYQGVPGMSIAVVHDQEVIWETAYGVSDLKTRQPMTPHTLCRLGSVTKLFTSTAIMQLRDAGRLRLDDPVTKFLPWFQVQNPFPDSPAITVRHLLTHTSGLPRDAPLPYWTTHSFPNLEELKAVMPQIKLLTVPGERYHYSNLGMGLLGHIVTAASGERYEDYVQDHILRPLGMTHSTLEPSAEVRARMATQYMHRQRDGSRRIHTYYDTGALRSAANMVSNVEDLARFAALQFRDGVAGGEQILSGSTLAEMHRAQFVYPSWHGGRGIGFAVSHDEDSGTTFVQHGGWIGGFRTDFLLDPARKLAVIVMTNADDASPGFFAGGIYEVFTSQLDAASAEGAEERQPHPEWASLLGDYADPWGWEYRVMIVGNDLVMRDASYPPDDDPQAGLTRLKPVEGLRFELPDGEPVVFELNDAGEVTRIQRRWDYITPVKR